MPTNRLSKRPARLVLEDVLIPNWQSSNAHGWGFDPDTSDATLSYGTDIDAIGEEHPSIVVSAENETVAGASGYSALASSGAIQDRDGSVVATIRVERKESGRYTTGNRTGITGQRLAYLLRAEVEDVITENADAPGTDLYNVTAFPAGAAPDDRDSVPTTFLVSVAIPYNWLKE